MTETAGQDRFRFGIFEADATTGELRRKGVRVRIHSQPFLVLTMLLRRPGELLTREEIAKELWPDGTFVDYEHGVNSAVNRLREALGDKASSPQYVETLARRGYRFLAPVERICEPVAAVTEEMARLEPLPPRVAVEGVGGLPVSLLATDADLPESSDGLVRSLFLLLQVMYVGFYVGALANLPEINDVLSGFACPAVMFGAIVVTAAVLIPVRTFLVCTVLFRAPGLREKYLRVWPFLLPFDLFWALAPFLLLHHISFGVALACATLLVYSPFAQRSLLLMATVARE